MTRYSCCTHSVINQTSRENPVECGQQSSEQAGIPLRLRRPQSHTPQQLFTGNIVSNHPVFCLKVAGTLLGQPEQCIQ
jgi:hypothetical protein